MKQLSLFDVLEEERKEEVKQIQEHTEYGKYNVCPKCKVLPIERKTRVNTIDGGTVQGTSVICPLCGYMVHTIYDKYEHWNTCNMYRVRDGKL